MEKGTVLLRLIGAFLSVIYKAHELVLWKKCIYKNVWPIKYIFACAIGLNASRDWIFQN